MKKFLALTALVLGLASCQTEPEGFDVNVGGNQETLINVSLPEATRSADSGIANVDFNTYDLRYVLEVYDMAYTPASLVYRDVKATDDTTTTFGVRLIPGRDYKFVVWADIVENGSTEDNYYVTANGLDEVALVDAKWTAMTETRDAYTGYVVIEKYNSASTIEMTLIRPFGKLRVVTTDIDAIAKLQNNALPKSVSVTYGVNAYTKFNALEATASESVAKTFTYDLTNVYGESGNQLTLFADYLFGTTSGTMQFQMDVTHENGNVTSNTFNTEIPIVRNQLTTLIGPILTDANNVKIEIDDKFAIEEITLTDNLVVDRPMVIEAGTTAILNLNGFNITNKVENTETDVIVVEEGAKLTIEGEGNITAVSGNDGYAVIAEGTVIINGGTFQAGHDAAGDTNAVVYARGNGKVYVNDGTFLGDDADRYVLNKKDADRATTTIEVRGGQFENFDPANNKAEGANTNFCAEGYGTIVSGDYYVVVPNIVVHSADELEEALKKGDVYITLANDITLDKALDITGNQYVKLDLNGKKITVTKDAAIDGRPQGFSIRKGSTLTITGDGTVVAEDQLTNLFVPRGDLVIENGTFIKNVTPGTAANDKVLGYLFIGISGGTGTVTINGGYFDGGYYDPAAADIDELIAGTKTLVESAEDEKNRGKSTDRNAVRVALKNNIQYSLNMSGKNGNDLMIYGGTFVGVNPAWGDEGCMLPTTPNYLRPWSHNQGAFLDGQEFNENGPVIPAGYTITKGATTDGRPTYTVEYNK